MFVVGLTGGIGSGKSSVAALFARKGITVIDADVLAREVVAIGSPALAQIVSHFGPDILEEDGALKRSELRRIVFANVEQRNWLENLLHPLIADRMRTRIAGCTSEYCIVESPLLLETDQYKLVDRILAVDVDESTQLRRTTARDGSDEKTIRAIIASQIPRADRIRRADDIIDNERTQDELATAVDKMHRKYLKMADKVT